MAEYDWPESILPHATSFFLEQNAARMESPLSRAGQVIIRSGARWVVDLQMDRRSRAVSAQLDALLALLDGPGQEVRLYDFRRPTPRGPAAAKGVTASLDTFTDGFAFTDSTFWDDAAEQPNVPAVLAPAATGAETLATGGWSPSASALLAGDYIGVDGRIHMVVQDAVADAAGKATLTIRPRLRAPVVGGVTANSIPNPDAAGLATGTPGTPPTGWAMQAYGGLSVEITFSGSSAGRPHVVFRAYGTASGGAGALRIWFAPISIVAAVGQHWKMRVLHQRPFTSQIATASFELSEIDAAAATVLATNTASIAVPAATPAVAQQDVEGAWTLGNANTAFIRPNVLYTFPNGAVDTSVLLAWPRLVQFPGPVLVTNRPRGRFRLADNSQGRNRTEMALRSSYGLTLVESLP